MHLRTTSPAWSVREIVMVVAIVICALVARSWHISGNTLDHFDEGVYAFSALGVADSHQPHTMYPSQEIFSPPFYFGLAGLIARAVGMTPDRALVLVSVLFGTLTVLVTWWTTRRWFGAPAGAAAAALLALSPFHIAFSRSALTDITFTFWLVCALGLLVAAVEMESFELAIWAGIATGLAWNTKYHGWFALLISGAALLPYCWTTARRGGGWLRPVLVWLSASIVAFLLYLPWLIYLKTRPGGYQGMATHYLGMLRTNWLANLLLYAQQLMFFEGPVSRVAVPLALAVAALLAARSMPAGRKLLVLALVVSVMSVGLGSIGVASVCVLVAVPVLISQAAPFRHWVILGWIALWVVAAPVYQPYARLLLPWLVAAYMVTGFVFQRAIAWATGDNEPSSGRLQRWTLITAVAATLVVALKLPTAAHPWRRDRGMSSVADAMATRIPQGQRVIAIIEPTAAFYLHQLGRPAFERAGNFNVLDTLSTPAYVVTGGYVRRSKRLRKRLEELAPSLTSLGTFAVNPSDVRLLDDLQPAAARRYRPHPDSTFDLHLFRFDPR